mgnify:CR=1 FL=1
MKEEVGRILGMLEDGKINAQEAEKLIRALCDTASDRTAPGDRRHSEEPRQCTDILKSISRALKAAARRQRRMSCLQYYWACQRRAEARSRRAATMSTSERVERLFVECGLGDPGGVPPTASLDEDLHFDDLARQVLRYALEDEFGLTVTADEALGMAAVADVVAFVERRLAPTASADAVETGVEAGA